jgi:succinate dehydrogenase/fumarate reductase flavoprotein subunit
VEAGPALGGTAVFSGGWIHVAFGAKTWDDFRRVCPEGDPVLMRVLFDNFSRYCRWLEATGAPGRYGRTASFRNLAPMELYEMGSKLPRDHAKWFAFLGHRFRSLGGKLLLRTRARALALEGGQVVGLDADCDGKPLSIHARSVVLATGGFQNSPRLLAENLGASPDNCTARAVTHDIGDGLVMATDVGARLTSSMDTVYGHLVPAPPCEIRWHGSSPDPGLLTVFYAESGIVVNIHGERFADEGLGELSGELVNSAVKQPPGGLWVIFDNEVRRRYVPLEFPRSYLWRPYNARHINLVRYFRPITTRHGERVMAIDGFQLARDRGAVVVEGQTIEALARRLAEYGVAEERLVATISEYNAATRDEKAQGLSIPKGRFAYGITHPPLYAMKVAAGVSMTYGGVAINERTQVLDRKDQVIPGLYAVPGTAGGVFKTHYGGALASCGVFGMIAGEQA